MEEKIVILSKLTVKKLYGNYDYDVKFNADVTLLYGTNGCGKTTILNIITSIITGSIYKLFSYKFEKIVLNYYDERDNKIKKRVSLIKKIEDNIEIDFQEQMQNIIKIQMPEERRHRVDSLDALYLEEYPVLKEIRKEFNYVYLALNRAAALSNNDEYYYMKRRRFFLEEDSIIEPDRIDPEIRYVESLINRRYVNATTQTNKINNEFRNSILKSALDVNIQTDLGKFLSDFNVSALRKTDISEIKNSYMKILSDLQIISEEEKKQYAVFFDNYSKLLKNVSSKMELTNMFSLFTAYNEMKKIQRIVDIAADAEQQKADIMHPIELYLDTVNEFISTSDFEKKIDININGRVYFKTNDSENYLSIQYLSSGERQLLVFLQI